MGVTELWSVLSPVQETVSLYSLAGKTLAVDLSLWVCEAQHVQAMMGKVTKPHLRNLFFRASSLLRMGVKLVFVMEGEAPKIKAETMSKRTEMGFRGVKTKGAPKHAVLKSTSRGRFKAVLRECAEMLDCLGVPWVQAAGEAEALCAFLDSQGFVDGCITNDGDAFLYGAQTVYRNFNMNTKDPQIDCYRMSRVTEELQLERETLVGVALLLGCDYLPKGVAGVGKEQTLKLIKNLQGQTLLQKFNEWKRSTSETLQLPGKKVSHCLVCHHPGSAKSHERNGCVFCDSKRFCQPQDYDSQCPCDWHRSEHARQASAVEANIKKKTLACDKFPFTEIINEFLIPKDKPIYSFRRRKPNLLLMQNFALDKLEWPKHYTSKKVLELLTYVELVNRRHGTEMPTQIEPLRIYKRRIRNGLSCFEVIWRKPVSCCEENWGVEVGGVICGPQVTEQMHRPKVLKLLPLDTVNFGLYSPPQARQTGAGSHIKDHYVFPEDCPPDDPDVVRTVEEENLFSVSYPHLVQLFHKEISEAKDSRSKQKKVTVEKVKSTESPDGFSDLFARMSLQTSSGLHLPASLETNQNILTALRTVAPTIPPHDAPKSLKRSSDGSETQAAADAPPTPQDCQRGLPSSPCPTGTAPQAQSSPSVSTLINQLHLSSIDWEALSFTASPCSQPQCSKADLGSVNNVDEGARTSDCSSSTAVKSDCGELTVLQAEGLSECPLRERVLKRNMGKSEDLLNSGEHLTRIILHTSQSEDTDSGRSLKPKSCQPVTKRHILPLQQHRQSGPSRPGARVLKDTTATTNTQKPKECSLDRVPPKSRFVKLKHSLPSSVLPQRSYSDPGHDRPFSDMEHTNQQRTCKKTVCTSQGSSSEDSDVENHNRTDHRKNTFKSKARSKLQHAEKTALPHLTQNRSSVVFMKLNPVRTKQRSDTTKSSSQPLGVVFSGTPPQIQTSSRRSEGSDCSVDSPRPLVERLKLKPK